MSGEEHPLGSLGMYDDSRAGKNIYVTGSQHQADLYESTVGGMIDMTNGGQLAKIKKSTVNGQWYEEAVVVDEISEHEWYYFNDEVTVFVGKTS